MQRRVAALVFVMCAVAVAYCGDDGPMPASSFVHRIANPRRIEIRKIGPVIVTVRPSVDEAKVDRMADPVAPASVLMTDPVAVREFMDLVRIDDTPFGEAFEMLTPDGKTEMVYPPCQCEGDFRVTLSFEKAESVSFSIHHDGQFIRFLPEQGLYEWRLIPPYGAKLNEVLKEKTKGGEPGATDNPGDAQ